VISINTDAGAWYPSLSCFFQAGFRQTLLLNPLLNRIIIDTSVVAGVFPAIQCHPALFSALWPVLTLRSLQEILWILIPGSELREMQESGKRVEAKGRMKTCNDTIRVEAKPGFKAGIVTNPVDADLGPLLLQLTYFSFTGANKLFFSLFSQTS